MLRLYFLITLLIPTLVQASSFEIYTSHWPPHIIVNDGNISGTATAKVRALFKYSNLNYRISSLPCARAYRIASTTKSRMIYPLTRTKERDAHFLWVGPLINAGNFYLYRLRDRSKLNISNLSELHKYTLAIRRDGIEQAQMHELGLEENKHYHTVNDESQAIRMLLKRRVDFVSETESAMPSLLKSMDITQTELVKVIKWLPVEQELFLGINKDTPIETYNLLKTGFQQAVQSQEFD